MKRMNPTGASGRELTRSSYAVLAIVIAALVAGLPLPAAATDTIELGIVESTLYSNEVTALVNGIGLGLRCAFAVANASGGVHGKPIVLRSRPSDFSVTNYGYETEQLLATYPNITAIVGSMGNAHITNMAKILEPLDLLHIGPVTGDLPSRGWNPTNMFIRPDPWAEMVALATALVSKFRIKKVAFEYTINGFFGEEYYEPMTSLMEELGVEWIYVFRYDDNVNRGNAPTNFSVVEELTKFLLEKPDAVISFGGADTATVEFFVGCLTHPLAKSHAPNLKFFVTEALALALTLSFQAANAQFNAGADPTDRIYSTFTFPLSTDTSYEVVRNYQRDMQSVYGDAWKQAVGYTAIGGYVTGRLAVEVLNRTAEPLTRKGIKDTVYKTTIWEVDDMTYGIFNGECSGTRNVLCNCNEGAHEISFGTVDSNYNWRVLPDVKYQWPVSTCTGKELRVTQPTNYLQLSDNSGVTNADALLALLRRGKVGAENTSTAGSYVVGDIRTENITQSGFVSELETLNTTLIVTTVAQSIVRPEVVTASPWPVVDPYYPEVRASAGFVRQALLTSSTAEQEIHALASFVASVNAGSMRVIVPTRLAGSLSAAVEGSCRTFGIGGGVVGYSSVTELNAALSASSGLIVVGGVGLDAAALSAVTAFASSTTTTRIAFFSSEFNAVYDALVAVDTGATSSLGDRLIVATSLPHWGPAGANASGLVQQYHSTLSAVSAAHPLELQSFVSTRAALIAVGNVNGKTTGENFAKAWYTTSLLFVDSALPLGPYFDAACSAATSGACECNVGPRRVNVFSIAGILRGSTGDAALTQVFPGCNVEYTSPADDSESSALSAGAIAGIAVAAVVIVGGLFAVSLLRGGDKRDTSFAPKDASKPYTLVFTDIQSSTSLWARAPEVMGPALDTHHALIRKLIGKHRGYEVKTIGDAFMIAFTSTDDAVELCAALQREFLAYDWGGDAIDETYRQMEQELLEEDPEGNKDKAPTCKLPAALYKKSWNGLRVRCGIHTGVGDIKFDEITKGYDYYGNVPNIAARTEACGNGGQVVLTSFALSALKKTVTTTELGPASLRGVTDPIQMYELQAIPGRTFAPLRLDKANEDDGTTEDTATVDSMHNSVSLSVSHAGSGGSVTSGISATGRGGYQPEEYVPFSDGFQTLLSVLDDAGRRSVIRNFAEKWRIHVPHDGSSSKTEVVKTMQKAIVRRIVSVVAAKNKKERNKLNGSTQEGMVESMSLATPMGGARQNTDTSFGMSGAAESGNNNNGKPLVVDIPGMVPSNSVNSQQKGTAQADPKASSDKYEVVNPDGWSPRKPNDDTQEVAGEENGDNQAP